jgi:hypothetical protein
MTGAGSPGALPHWGRPVGSRAVAAGRGQPDGRRREAAGARRRPRRHDGILVLDLEPWRQMGSRAGRGRQAIDARARRRRRRRADGATRGSPRRVAASTVAGSQRSVPQRLADGPGT